MEKVNQRTYYLVVEQDDGGRWLPKYRPVASKDLAESWCLLDRRIDSAARVRVIEETLTYVGRRLSDESAADLVARYGAAADKGFDSRPNTSVASCRQLLSRADRTSAVVQLLLSGRFRRYKSVDPLAILDRRAAGATFDQIGRELNVGSERARQMFDVAYRSVDLAIRLQGALFVARDLRGSLAEHAGIIQYRSIDVLSSWLGALTWEEVAAELDKRGSDLSSVPAVARTLLASYPNGIADALKRDGYEPGETLAALTKHAVGLAKRVTAKAC